MDLIVRNGEREEKVTVERHLGGFRVKVGERAYDVDAVVSGGAGRSLIAEGRQYEIAVRADGDRGYQVTSARGSATVEVLAPLARLAETSRGGGDRQRAERVAAYMPGRVVTVLAEEGSRVSAGQGVLVLEAMKMENEIQAPHDGVVRRLLVAAGEAVEGGDALFEIE